MMIQVLKVVSWYLVSFCVSIFYYLCLIGYTRTTLLRRSSVACVCFCILYCTLLPYYLRGEIYNPVGKEYMCSLWFFTLTNLFACPLLHTAASGSQPASQQINVFTQQLIYLIKYSIYINFFVKYMKSSEICI